MSNLTRRETIKLMSMASLAAGFTWSEADLHRANKNLEARAVGAGVDEEFAPEFFTEHELETVRVLVDLIIPADERSGSATDAGVPEFMDFMMIDRPENQTPMRGGLAWMDLESLERFGTTFTESTDAQRREILDDIAYPETAPETVSPGVEFFSSFRDLTASGFWTTKMGIEDLQYIGNEFVQEWTGCPDEALEQLGVSYDES